MCRAHDFLLSASSWICIPQPSGLRGILLKSNIQKRWACADTVGVEFDGLSRFTVSSAWGRSLSHNANRKDGSASANMEMKWFLKIFQTSAMFLLWQHRGTDFYSYSWLITSFMFLEQSLSKMCFLTCTLVSFILFRRVKYALLNC